MSIMSSIAMYYYYVSPSHNTQDFLRTNILDRKRGEKYCFDFHFIITYHNEKYNIFFKFWMILSHRGEVFYHDRLNDWERLLIVRYVAKFFLGAWGAGCNRQVGAGCTNVTICPHYLPIVLQIAPIDYGNYVTTCPYKYYMYLYRYI